MLCGYPPFYGESDQEVLDEALKSSVKRKRRCEVRQGKVKFQAADWPLGKQKVPFALGLAQEERVRRCQSAVPWRVGLSCTSRCLRVASVVAEDQEPLADEPQGEIHGRISTERRCLAALEAAFLKTVRCGSKRRRPRPKM